MGTKRSQDEVALEWIGLMRKELVHLKERIDWLDRGLSYIELNFTQKIQMSNTEVKEEKP